MTCPLKMRGWGGERREKEKGRRLRGKGRGGGKGCLHALTRCERNNVNVNK